MDFRSGLLSVIVCVAVLCTEVSALPQQPDVNDQQAAIPSASLSNSAAEATDTSKEAIVVKHFGTRVVYNSDGTGDREVIAAIRVQSDAGVRSLAVLRFAYNSANDSVEIAHVRVKKTDGKVVATPETNIQDMPAEITRAAPFYSDIHEKHVTVKGLSVGDVLEYQVRFRTLKAQVPGQFWYEHNFFKDNVVEDEELEINVPKDKYVKVSSPKILPQVREEGARRIYVWKTANLRRYDALNHTAKREAERPSVLLSTFHSWEEVGQWYSDLQKAQAKVTPEIQAKGLEITKGLTGDERKIRALYDFVATRVHYVSLSFGIGRYQPHAASDVLGNEYGDCKDKHTLFAALLKAAGYDAWAALINGSQEIDADVPSPGQFNHLVTALSLGNDVIWLDTTAEVAPFGLLINVLRDKQALVMPSEGPARLMKTPALAPFPNAIKFMAEGKLDPDGTLTAHVEHSSRGDEEVVLRAAFRRVPPAQWKELMQQISHLWGFAGDVDNVVASSPENLEEPFHLSYDYTRKDYGDWNNQRIVAPLPVFGLENGMQDEKKPSEPVALGNPGEVVFRASITLPPQSAMQVPAPLDVPQEFADYHADYEFKDGIFTSERRLRIKKTEVPVESWDSYLKFRKSIADDREQWFTLSGVASKGEGLARPPSSDLDAKCTELYDRAYAAGQVRDYRTAADLYTELLKLNPKYPWAWNNLGRMQIRLGLAREAITSLKKALEVEPQDDLAYRNLARAYLALGDQEQALESCRAQIRMRPNDDFCNMTVAKIMVMQGKYSEAIPALQDAIRILPAEPSLRVALGTARLDLGDDAGAMSAFKEALQISKIPTVWMQVSFALSEHKVHLDEALQYANSAADVTVGLLQAMVQQKQYREASRLSEELVYCWEAIAHAHLQKGNLNVAEQYATAAWKTKLAPGLGMTLFKVYNAMGETQRAQEVGDEMVTYFSEPGEAARMLERLSGVERTTAEERLNLATMRPRRDVLPLTAKATSDAEDDVWLVLSPSGSVTDLQFVEQQHSLDQFTVEIRKAQFDGGFPSESVPSLVRRGRISCSTKEGRCTFKLLPGLIEAVSDSERALVR